MDEVNTPWGNFNSAMSLCDQLKIPLKQLKSYQLTNNSDHLKKDIEGYEVLIKTGNDENVSLFLDFKKIYKEEGIVKNNLEIVNYIKNLGKWKL
jgi:hypothetical protein